MRRWVFQMHGIWCSSIGLINSWQLLISIVIQKPCEWSCPHIQCDHPCDEFCDREPCNKSCSKVLSCGHHCNGLCGEICPPKCPACSEIVLSKSHRKSRLESLAHHLLKCYLNSFSVGTFTWIVGISLKSKKWTSLWVCIKKKKKMVQPSAKFNLLLVHIATNVFDSVSATATKSKVSS